MVKKKMTFQLKKIELFCFFSNDGIDHSSYYANSVSESRKQKFDIEADS